MKVEIGEYSDSDEEQHVDVRIDPWDTWSMDETLAHIILPMLKQLRDTKHGSPNVDSSDVPSNLRCNDVSSKAYWTNGETDENYHKRWDWVLDEMIWSFEQKMWDWEEQFCSGEIDFIQVPTEDGGYRLERGPNDTYKIDYESRKVYQERISNGFRLFGKYYESLWD